MCVKVHQFSRFFFHRRTLLLSFALIASCSPARTHTHTLTILVRLATYSAILVVHIPSLLDFAIFLCDGIYLPFWQESMRQKWERVHFNRFFAGLQVYTHIFHHHLTLSLSDDNETWQCAKCKTIGTERKPNLQPLFTRSRALSLSVCRHNIAKKIGIEQRRSE